LGQAQNLHASAVLLGDRGVLIAGESGFGKTTLALALVDYFTRLGHFSRLVSDDQVLIEGVRGRLVCHTPQPISGIVEIYGIGPRPLEFEPSMIADLLVRLVPSAAAQRFPEVLTESVAACDLACLELTARNARAAVLAVASWFSIPPFYRETGDRRS
jgi:serine kinase of HPr protein (carbohydrate metabolism regulator)